MYIPKYDKGFKPAIIALRELKKIVKILKNAELHPLATIAKMIEKANATTTYHYYTTYFH